MASSGVGKQVTSKSTDSHSTCGPSETKNNQPSSSQPRASTMYSSGPSPSGGAAGGSGWDPSEPREGVSHLAMYISDEDKFTDDLHQIIPIKDAFALPCIPRPGLEGFDCGYLLPAEITAF